MGAGKRPIAFADAPIRDMNKAVEDLRAELRRTQEAFNDWGGVPRLQLKAADLDSARAYV